MYLYFHEVYLMQPAKARPNDPPVYEREYRGERILALDNRPAPGCDPGRRYGTCYLSTRDEFCVAPDVWSDDDAMLARGGDWPEVTGDNA